MDRRDKTNYYLDMAQVALERGTCLRRKFGAIIVKNDSIVSTGYAGAPRGRLNCCDRGVCLRDQLNIPRGERYELDLVLRNNITTPEHPLGVFHPHAKLHHIKKENIGLIEVMGLAVLPSRLKKELFELADALVARTPVSQYPEELQKHAEWAEDILARHPELNGDTVHLILQDEVGHVFAQVLADAGVYKMDEAGRAGFVRFLASVQ